jgi:YD repeat-containing protein
VNETICPFCEKWAAQTWHQHQTRMRNIRLVPDAKPHSCPRCGGTYWASKPPSSRSDEEDAANVRMAIGGGLVLAVVMFVFAFALMAGAHAQTTFRNDRGQITGYVSTDSNGTRTFRDGTGRTTGTATRDSNGTTTFRDAGGRTTGTATAPRR